MTAPIDMPPPAPSLWAEVAEIPPGVPAPLAGDITADVAIVGAGYTGLCAALHLVAAGRSVVVLDAGAVGYGASGRNGGVVSTKYRASLSDMARSHGQDRARAMYRLGHEAVDHVAEMVDRHAIPEAQFTLTGNLRCAHTPRAFAALRAEMDVAREVFGDRTTEALTGDEVRGETGSDGFVGGVLARHSGLIRPLDYARGLARALGRAGGRICEQSPVLRIETAGRGRRLITPGGSVTAAQVILATNGYSDLTGATPGPRRAVVPFRSAMIATAPLSDNLRATVMAGCRSYSETRRMMRWFRPMDGRMIFGGRGAFGRTDSAAAFDALHAAMLRLFPQLQGVAITHRWSGLVAMTMNSLPQVGRIDDATSFAIGYNGAGIAMASLMGARLGEIVAGGRPDLGLMGPGPLRTVPFHALRGPAVRVVAGWYQLLDRAGL